MAPAVEAGAGAGATASEADPPWPPRVPCYTMVPGFGTALEASRPVQAYPEGSPRHPPL